MRWVRVREGGENKEERDITPANANHHCYTVLSVTLSELLEVYIF